MWSIANQFQTLILLLLTRAYFPEDTTSSFTGLSDYTSFSFKFIPYSSLNIFSIITNWFSIPVSGVVMQRVGLTSGSTFINNVSLLLNVLWTICFHLTFLIVRRLVASKLASKPCIKKVIDAIYRLFTLCLYLRLFMETFQFLLICSTDEIFKFNHETESKTTSLAIAFVVFALCTLFVLFTLLLTIREVKAVGQENKYFNELFNGTKETKFSRFYSFVFIIRKTLIIAFMGFLVNISIYIKVGFFVLVQTAYFAYIVIVRPLDKAKDNLICILNETLMLMLANMLFKYNTEPDWTSTAESIFFVSISVVSMLTALICIGR